MIDDSSNHAHATEPELALPAPGSDQLGALGLSALHEKLYVLLYERMPNPPTMREIRASVAAEQGEAPSQTDRRVRDLRGFFHIKTIRRGRDYCYLLTGLKQSGTAVRKPISSRVRAQILSHQRCAQCGKTPLDHHVLLDVDHKVPVEWGGSDDASNLQPLCQDCNAGKKAYFATYDKYADEIRSAANHEETHKRIGELLKAFDGDWVPSDLLGAVASMKQYQEDWQKRLRELRIIDWVITSKRQTDATTGRSSSFYRADSWTPWPAGNIAAEIKRRERSKRSK
ncbi:HNH endonuclease [Streptomyces sp. NPDC002012]|uniref:HNH endonuclease n=1 Tax=Streptomyces sp. NPDC002012 TaxID=3154532 RepID=UPI0033294C43